ncbi:integral membrane protein [Phlyctema vagabunda]|uniref:Integral membrane protein n=1 Tax=Phlyctema vagabunda TaxID=108571 RepID=A0ABR4PAI0_9HELO
MAGANILMLYSNAAGDNVTLSPRLGVGEVDPTFDYAADVTLLSGSRIADGMMIANIRCSNCNSWPGGSMAFNDATTEWIFAYLEGDPIASDSTGVSLREHNQYGYTNINLQNAVGGTNDNPFLNTITTPAVATVGGGGGIPSNHNSILIAHAVLTPVAFVLFFPLGGMAIKILNFRGLLYFHAGWMILALAVALAGTGLGIWLANEDIGFKHEHTIIGLVAVGGLLLQPFTGTMHHYLYKKLGRKNIFTLPHIFWGRAFIFLGIINGGLGLKLSNNTNTGKIVYGVVSGVIGISWLAVVVWSATKSRRRGGQQTRERLVATNSDGEKMSGTSEQLRN